MIDRGVSFSIQAKKAAAFPPRSQAVFASIPPTEERMTDTLTPLILDFLEWTAARPRSYADAMDIWRTSCPRLTVWEDAVDRGWVVPRRGVDRELLVALTPAGAAFLAASGRVTVMIKTDVGLNRP